MSNSGKKFQIASLCLVMLTLSGCQMSRFFRPKVPDNTEPSSYLTEQNNASNAGAGQTIADQHALYDLGPDTLSQQQQVAKMHQEGTMPAVPTLDNQHPFSDLPTIPKSTSQQSRTPFDQVPLGAAQQSSGPFGTSSPSSSVNSTSYTTPANVAQTTAQHQTSQPAPQRPNVGVVPSSQTQAASVTIRGVKTNGGPVRVAVFDRASGFPKDEGAAFKMVIQPTASTLTQSIPLNIKGPYALAVYQDENDDRQLNKGAFGVPKEPYGFSKNADGKYGPPKFADAALSPGDAVDLTLR